MMRVVQDYPPLIDEIDAAFHVRGKPVLFAWGDTVYNPKGAALPPCLHAHEAVHGARQAGDPAGWWRRYIADRAFRLQEEIPAHVAELKVRLRDCPSRPARRRCIRLVAQRLCNPVYRWGGQVTLDQAIRLLKAAVRQ